jgi:PleD family two-component response regulator
MFTSLERKQLGSSRDDMTRMPGEATARYQPLSIPAGSLLVVDDNSMNRIMLSRYITKLGYQATLVENGRQALDQLQGEPFDLVLLRARLTACLERKRLRDQEVDYLQQV